MIKGLLSICLLSMTFLSHGQTAQYWQQKINYDMSFYLDDQQDELTGTQEVTYVNNSPDTLHAIHFHLIPNALTNNRTPYLQQRIKESNRSFYFSDPTGRTFMEVSKITSGIKPLSFELVQYNEFLKVNLDQALLPGHSLKLQTAFKVKLTKMDYRFGKQDSTYYNTYLYPKVCAYSTSGWHLDPYLYNGELFQDFGDYQVTILLDTAFEVAATGEMIDKVSVPDRPELAEYTFKETNIHDFAWIASKAYRKNDFLYETKDGETVNVEISYHEKNEAKWKNGISYVKGILDYFTQTVGTYPYDHLKIVEGRSGMEYPGLVVVDGYNGEYRLEQSMLHEIGHQWFFAALATDQASYVWLDEGVCTFYEFEYLSVKYPEMRIFGLDTDAFPNNFGNDLISLFDLGDFDFKSSREFLYQFLASKNADQPISTKAGDFTFFNYTFVGYLKASLLIEHLSYSMGKAKFNQAMREYYQEWKFKHPSPRDLLEVLERHSDKSLNWFSSAINRAQKIDPKVTARGNALLVKLNDAIPLEIGLYNDSALVQLVKMPVQAKEIRLKDKQGFNRVVIDPNRTLPDINRSNNQLIFNGRKWLRNKKLRIRLVASIDDPETLEFLLLPIVGYNTTDKFMLGLTIYNDLFQTLPLSYQISPLYSFGQKGIRGSARFNYHFINKSNLSLTRISPFLASYSGYQKLGASGSFFFKKKAPLTSENLTLSFFKYFIDAIELPQYPKDYHLGAIEYNRSKSTLIKQVSINARLESDFSSFVKLSVEPKFELQYLRNTYLNLRGFAGIMLNQSTTNEVFNFNLSGSNDYQFDEIFLDRAQKSEVLAGFSNQSDLNEGGFKSYAQFSSSTWITSLNLSMEIPEISVLGLFGDVGYLPSSGFQYDWGLQFRLLKDIAYIYFPLGGVSYASGFVGDTEAFKENIRFSLKLNFANPFYQLDRRLGLRY